MDEQRLLGILIIAGTIFLAIIIAVWLRGHLERRQGKGRHRGKTVVHQEPEPGSFTAAVLNAERAVSLYREAVFIGNLDALIAARNALTKAHARLVVALVHREVEKRRRDCPPNAARRAADYPPYASGPGDVTVSSSDTGGAPHGEDHRPKHR